MIVLFFYFIDTATTYIYTYLHPLSLHDALPISGASGFVGSAALQHVMENTDWRVICPSTIRHYGSQSRLLELREKYGNRIRVVPRSEEHTSELQSLMRLSYAVFCLKKK